MRERRFGVVDLGSNTVHLLVARSDGKTITPVLDLTTSVRLGADVDADGAIGTARLATTLDTLREYISAAEEAGVRRLHLLATHAIRVATNGASVRAIITSATGLPVQVLTPEQEAALSFAGASAMWNEPGPRVVLDIGGGSMQVAVGDGPRLRESRSWPLGAARLVAQYLPNDPPTASDITELAAILSDEIVIALPDAKGAVSAVLGVGGTLRRLPRLVGSEIGLILPPGTIKAAQAAVQGRTTADIAALYAIDQVRARLLLPALLVLREVVRGYNTPPVTISPYGVREGAILRLARYGAI